MLFASLLGAGISKATAVPCHQAALDTLSHQVSTVTQGSGPVAEDDLVALIGQMENVLGPVIAPLFEALDESNVSFHVRSLCTEMTSRSTCLWWRMLCFWGFLLKGYLLSRDQRLWFVQLEAIIQIIIFCLGSVSRFLAATVAWSFEQWRNFR